MVDHKRIKGFDGLRALAVIMVWLEHRTSLTGSGIGGAGVGMFFALSGYLIINILRKQREAIENTGSTFWHEWKLFICRRAYRIFPVYFLFLGIILPPAYLLGNAGIDATAIVMHVFYMVNIWVDFVLGHFNNFTSHLWSLSVEEQFYVIFPILALNTPSKKLPSLCALVILFAIVVRIILIRFSTPLAADTFSLVAFGHIALGGFFVLLLTNRNLLSAKSSALPAALLVGYISAPVIVFLYGSPESMNILRSLPLTVFVGIVLVMVQANQSSFLVKFLEFTPLRGLGTISYGFYVFHYPLSTRVFNMAFHINLSNYLSENAILFVEFMLPLIAATLSWHIIEKPILARRPSNAKYVEIEQRNIRTCEVGISEESVV